MEEEPLCPFCGSQDNCEHLLLVVDKTFRTANGGILRSAFNERWSALCELGGDDFDEQESFESLLEEADSLADTATDYDVEGGPGMSTSCTIYFVLSQTDAQDALVRFRARCE